MYFIYGIAAFLASLLFYMVFIEPRRLKQKHYFIRKNNLEILDISKAYDLYQEQTNIVVAHISDTHFSNSYQPLHFNPVIKSILQNSPDLIVFTGDLVNNYKKWPHRYSQRLIEKLTRLSAPMGKIAILGNHDYLEDGHYFVQEVFKESGFTLLKNEELFGANDKISINVTGIDDCLRGEPHFDYEPTLAEWHLLLLHEPDAVQAIDQIENYNLVLSGHSHGGQVRLPFIHLKHDGATKYTHGMYLLKEKTLLSISNGLGTSGLPIRLGAPPEIIYYHLAKETQEAAADD